MKEKLQAEIESLLQSIKESCEKIPLKYNDWGYYAKDSGSVNKKICGCSLKKGSKKIRLLPSGDIAYVATHSKNSQEEVVFYLPLNEEQKRRSKELFKYLQIRRCKTIVELNLREDNEEKA